MTYFRSLLLKNLRRAVAWVAFEVALATVCIPLEKEGKVGYDLLYQ